MKRKLLFGFVLGVALFGLIGAMSNMGALTLTAEFIVGTYQTIGTYLTVGTYAQVGTEVRAPEFVLGSAASSVDSLGRIINTVRNKSGATLVAGMVVEWDTLEVKWDSITTPFAVYTDTASILSTEGVPVGLKVKVWGTPSNDSFFVYGTTINNDGVTQDATTETMLLNVANDTRYSDYIWSAIDSVLSDSGAATATDSLILSLVPCQGVVLGGVTPHFIAGVVVSTTIADNGIGEICVYGAAQARSKTASGTFVKGGYPVRAGADGTVLISTAAGAAVDSAIVYWGTIVGRALGTKDDVSDTTTIWIFVDPR